MKLGQKVTATRELMRIRNKRGNKYNRQWVPQPLPGPREGILVGLRILNNGNVYQEDEGWGVYTVYEAKEIVRAALVAFDLRQNPILTPLEDVQP